jgi:hypothetical protein
MTPSEIADNALNATLEKVQSLMKLCIKLKASDPGTLTLSDEIARRLVSFAAPSSVPYVLITNSLWSRQKI